MRVDKILQKHLHTHVYRYIILTIIFIIGLVAGTASQNMLATHQVQELNDYVNQFIAKLAPETINVDLLEIMQTHLVTIAILFLCGIFIVGLPIIFLFICAKGFLLGFSISFLLNKLQLKGWLLVISSIMPQNVIALPAIFFMAVISIDFSLRHFKKTSVSSIRKWQKGYHSIGRYLLNSFFALGLLLISGIVEVYINPLLLQVMFYFIEH